LNQNSNFYHSFQLKIYQYYKMQVSDILQDCKASIVDFYQATGVIEDN
jgi:hypothetical protein